jgi:hypothetical protein
LTTSISERSAVEGNFAVTASSFDIDEDHGQF